MANHMLDAEPVEVAAIQGDELRDVKQQLAVIKSLYLPKPGKKAHQKIGIGGNHSLAFLANQETDQETDCGTVAQKYLRQTPCPATTKQFARSGRARPTYFPDVWASGRTSDFFTVSHARGSVADVLVRRSSFTDIPGGPFGRRGA